jgi:hypothetical protein
VIWKLSDVVDQVLELSGSVSGPPPLVPQAGIGENETAVLEDVADLLTV